MPNPLSRYFKSKHPGAALLSAFRTGLAATLCLVLGHLFGLQHSYWATISAIVVMGSDTAVTIASSRDRLIGTAIGALLGWATWYSWHHQTILYGLAVGLCLFLSAMVTTEKAGRLAAVALTIIVLIPNPSGPGRAAISRFCEVSLGIVIALAVTWLVFPGRNKKPA